MPLIPGLPGHDEQIARKRKQDAAFDQALDRKVNASVYQRQAVESMYAAQPPYVAPVYAQAQGPGEEGDEKPPPGAVTLRGRANRKQSSPTIRI